MNSPLVTIVIPFYKSRRHIEFAIQSALDQEHENLQIILVDNASPDDSGEIAARFTDPRIERVQIAENHGAAAGLQAGYQRARGEWVGLLPADDRWHPRFVSTLMAAASDKPEIDIVFSNFCDIDDEGNLYDWPERGEKWRNWTLPAYEAGSFLEDFVGFNMIHQFQTMLWRKELLWRIMPFAKGVIPCDWVMALRAFHRGARLLFVNECLVENRVHAAQVGLSMNQSAYARHFLFVHLGEFCFPLVQSGKPISPRWIESFTAYLTTEGLFNEAERVRLLLLRHKVERGKWPFVLLSDYLEHLEGETLMPHELAELSSLLIEKARPQPQPPALPDTGHEQQAIVAARAAGEEALRQRLACEERLRETENCMAGAQVEYARTLRKRDQQTSKIVRKALRSLRRLKQVLRKGTLRRLFHLMGTHRKEEVLLADDITTRLKELEQSLHTKPDAKS